MKVTKRQLKRIIKEEVQHFINESSRAGESHDAGYEDGSGGLDPKYLDDMDYMAGWETGNEDYQYDIHRDQKTNRTARSSSRRPAGRIHDVDEGTAYNDMPASWQQILGELK